jgi:hypothetical protein
MCGNVEQGIQQDRYAGQDRAFDPIERVLDAKLGATHVRKAKPGMLTEG